MKAAMDARGNLTVIAESGPEGYALIKWYEAILPRFKEPKKDCGESISIGLQIEVMKEEV